MVVYEFYRIVAFRCARRGCFGAFPDRFYSRCFYEPSGRQQCRFGCLPGQKECRDSVSLSFLGTKPLFQGGFTRADVSIYQKYIVRV
jgi:hypothetical protein